MLLIAVSVDAAVVECVVGGLVVVVGVRTTDLEPTTCTSLGSLVDSSSDE